MFNIFRKKRADYTNFNVPAEMGKDRSKLVSFITVEWAVIFSMFAVIAIFFIMLTILWSFWFIVPVILSGISWAVVARTTDQIDDSKMVASYFHRKFKGQTIISKYKMPDDVVLNHFPVETIHEGGLIEYTGGHYGILLMMDPPRTTDDGAYNTNLESVFNSLIPGDLLKIMACSRLNTYKPYSDDILTVANQDETTDEQRKHLHSIYQMVENNNNETVEWQFNAALVFAADDPEDAGIIVETRLPGLKALFNNAGVGVYQINDIFDIQLCMYQQLQREVLRA
jgi:hypothetical protein